MVSGLWLSLKSCLEQSNDSADKPKVIGTSSHDYRLHVSGFLDLDDPLRSTHIVSENHKVALRLKRFAQVNSKHSNRDLSKDFLGVTCLTLQVCSVASECPVNSLYTSIVVHLYCPAQKS